MHDEEHNMIAGPRLSLVLRAILPVFGASVMLAILPHLFPMRSLFSNAMGAVALTLVAFSTHRFAFKGEKGIAALASRHLPVFALMAIPFWFGIQYALGELQLHNTGLISTAWHPPLWPDMVMLAACILFILWISSKVALSFPALALGHTLTDGIVTTHAKYQAMILFRSVFQFLVVIGILAIIGALLTALMTSDLSRSMTDWSMFGLYVVRECVVALWVVAFSGLLGAIYQRKLAVNPED